MRLTRILVPFLFLGPLFFFPSLVSAQDAEELYEAKCGRCHAAYSPNSYGPEEWPGIVRSMRAQSGLTAEEEAMLDKSAEAVRKGIDSLRGLQSPKTKSR